MVYMLLTVATIPGTNKHFHFVFLEIYKKTRNLEYQDNGEAITIHGGGGRGWRRPQKKRASQR